MVNEMLSRSALFVVYENGQRLHEDQHFQDHIDHGVPIQIYLGGVHQEIGFVEWFNSRSVRVNNIDFDRNVFTFVSRPGY
ncbi:Putative uncharacterized protein [Thermobacillus xylanilyticus]|jgi:hypothetical protein|uniref:Uncharacterized protein n=2 Tax=Thermobacillus TaxID=76632 RepID=L0EHK7_THECK|nr:MULTISPECIES: hypothetical protein [Thermobacillus]AGA59738.1 hypothetical protein Theco_3719 [Thermobacillus composti KWC4]CAG5091829.1 Putative uncharacterized protein [Thermobacillus xylanilyticus]